MLHRPVFRIPSDETVVPGESIGTLATGIINTYFAIINDDDSNKSRCSLQSWWSEWLQSTEKIRLSTEQAIKLVWVKFF